MSKEMMIAAMLAFALAGCATKPRVKSAPLSLATAICQVQNAIVRTQRTENKAGLGVGEATVTLQLGIKETKAGDAGAKLTVGVVEWSAKGSYSRENTQGNTLTVKFIPGTTHLMTSGASNTTMQIEPPLPDCSKFD